MSNNSKNGFTLVEIIASITVLGIIVIVLFPAFTNIMQHGTNTEDKMIWGNLLERVSYDLRKDQSLATSIMNKSCQQNGEIQIDQDLLPENGLYIVNGKEFQVKLYKICSPEEEDLNIVRTKFQIMNLNNEKLDNKRYIESFVYLREGGFQ